MIAGKFYRSINNEKQGITGTVYIVKVKNIKRGSTWTRADFYSLHDHNDLRDGFFVKENWKEYDPNVDN